MSRSLQESGRCCNVFVKRHSSQVLYFVSSLEQDCGPRADDNLLLSITPLSLVFREQSSHGVLLISTM